MLEKIPQWTFTYEMILIALQSSPGMMAEFLVSF